MSQTTNGALSPYRVIDLTAEIGGLSTMVLAGLGADVIRVEPPGGHPTRKRAPMLREDDGSSLYWAQMNAGKRSITLDLDEASGQERLRALCETADFLFESDAPGTLASRGLGYEDLHDRAPQLIYVSITPFGQTGPKSIWAASDLIGHVSGGLSSLVGDPDRAPLRPSVEQAYNITALNAGSAAMIALHARHLTGRGQHVDVSMQAAMANTLGNARLYWEKDGIVTQRAGGARAFADRATRIIYPCADGYVAFVRVPASILRLQRWMSAEGADPQFDAERWASIAIAGDDLPTEDEIAELESEIERFFAAHGAQALYESGQHFNVMICPVNTMRDIVDSPQLSARAFFDEVDDPALGTLKVPGAPLKMSATPWQSRPAPSVGQHSDELWTQPVRTQGEGTGMTDDHLLIERRDNGVVVATLNRPEVLNALSPQIRNGLREMVADLRDDSDARALVITGAGRGFCSGADLSNRDERVAAENEPGLTSTELRYGFAAELQQLEIPVIAAVNGAAAGAGFAIALSADIRLMSDRARFHPAFIRIGLGPDWAASWTLTRLIGHSRALETFWTADPIDADRALELGIANRVIPHDDLMAETMALADRLAQNAPWASALTKRAIYAALNNDATQQAQLEELNQSWLRNSIDAREGARSFKEKRPPQYQRR